MSASTTASRWSVGSGWTVTQQSHTAHTALNAARSNAILVCHALTGDQYVAETHPITGKPGWWDPASLDSGRPDRHRPLSSSSGANILGGCMGPVRARGPSPGWLRRAVGIFDFPSRDRARHGSCAEATDRLPLDWAAVRHDAVVHWAACRCCNGSLPTPTRCSPRCRLRPRPITPRAEHRLQRSRAARPFSPDPNWAEGQCIGRPAASRPRVWRWLGCAPISRICRKRR